MGKVWFVGAGPGDPELITVRGRALLAEAGAVLHAGSLVDPAHLEHTPAGCRVADSSPMTLEEMVAWLVEQVARHPTVVRLQTGDPSLYGALPELVAPLRAAGVEVGVVPGVSSAMAAAAAAVQSLTVPEVSQTVILTRVQGRTPVPEGERLRGLAAHGATVCLFLSATLGREVAAELGAAGWGPDAPLLLVHRATYPDQRVVRTTLGRLVETLEGEGMRGQTMIIGGPVLGAGEGDGAPRSRLYDPGFGHGFRTAVKPGDGEGGA